MVRDFDVVVLGGGPAGYPAAIRAAQLGARVCLVEKAAIGGTCLNWGCIPTKALQAAAHAIEWSRTGAGRGVAGGPLAADAPALYANKDRVVRELVGGVEKILKARTVEIARGAGRFLGPDTLEVEGAGTVRGRAIIVATGSTEAAIPGLPFDGKRILTSADLLGLGRIPERMAIVGGGVIGCEFASIFNALGSKITIVEMLPRIVATEDSQISRTLLTYMRKRGIAVHVGTRVAGAAPSAGGVTVRLESGEEIEADVVLVSVGRRPLVDGFGLAEAGVTAGKGGIPVNARMETGVPGLYAAGDCVGGLLLAHVATREGTIAAENALGGSREMRYGTIPSTIYTLPEIAHVGMTEEEAASSGAGFRTGRFPFAANGKAKGLGEEEGFVKWVARAEDDRLLGLHVIGPHATELVASAVIALDRAMTASEYAESVFPHPTLSEALTGGAESIHGRAIDLIK